MAAPLFFSGDMERLDDFTLNILCNPEVIAVDQDPLGQCARVIKLPGGPFAMVKDLVEGGKAVGLFNPGRTSAKVSATWSELGLSGSLVVRDLWRQEDRARESERLIASLAPHGVLLVKLTR
jgi:alpha-galactosidase